jgi:hypothetical protein
MKILNYYKSKMYEIIIHKRVNKFIDSLENFLVIREKLRFREYQ